MFNFIRVSIFFVAVIFFSNDAWPIEPLKLKAGLLEGISESDFSYKLIEFNANGQHRMFTLKIASAFRKVKFRAFSDHDINCDITACVINIVNEHNPNENTRLIMTPHLDNALQVMEMSTDHNGQAIFTQTYQLDKQQKQSTVREFVHMYKDRLESLTSIRQNEFYGFWIGVLNIDGKPELLSFEAHPDKTSHFVRFVNGESFTNKASFTPANVSKVGSLIEIETDHLTFANKLLIHKHNAVLEGYMYSTYKGTTLQKGVFRLYRIKQ
ncbi:methionine sulfoxide reductase [Thalassotalea castellviae]|uniref:Methionine sulfoxide reductase n=1 Tax=Thalassotalea castellviae TaxID=3075612 RepID=A0ABU2ZZ40_9GAMM|nr:methionine sulfoxide reductase [Thalassotalea sp. W431]MDT0603192.1 methionine sulfoxide reductase [Thalassotalea sp. W431]